MKLNYKTFGQGDPLIILHGLFGTLDNWQTVGRQLAEHYSVYLIDQRNHGRSPHDPDIDYPILADDLQYFMESHWIYRSFLMGHSMGGKTVMQFALTYPDLVEKLIVVDIAPRRYSGGHESIFEALLSLDLEQLDSRQQAEEQLQERIDEEGVLQFLLKNLSRDKDGRYAWKMNLPALYQHYGKLMGEIEGPEIFDKPALFIRGERSDYIRDGDWPRILELFPQARLETVAGAGHWVHAEEPAELLRLVMAFLAE